jgi:hypothetical protein
LPNGSIFVAGGRYYAEAGPALRFFESERDRGITGILIGREQLYQIWTADNDATSPCSLPVNFSVLHSPGFPLKYFKRGMPVKQKIL